MRLKNKILTTLAISCLSLGVMEAICGQNDLTIAKAEAPASFTIADGAQVRKFDGVGIRFKASILTSELEALGAGAELGMLVIPTDILGDTELTSAVTSAVKIKAQYTYKEGDYTWFNAALIGTDGADFSVDHAGYNLTARAYVTHTGGTDYTTNTVERSMVYVANEALQATNEAEDEDNKLLFDMVDTVLGYDAEAGTPTVSFEQYGIHANVNKTLNDDEADMDASVTGNQGLSYKLRTDSTCITVGENNQLTTQSTGDGSVYVKFGRQTVTLPVRVYDVTDATTWNWQAQTNVVKSKDGYALGQAFTDTNDSAYKNYATSDYFAVEDIKMLYGLRDQYDVFLGGYALYTNNAETALSTNENCVVRNVTDYNSNESYNKGTAMGSLSYEKLLKDNPTAKYVRLIAKRDGNQTLSDLGRVYDVKWDLTSDLINDWRTWNFSDNYMLNDSGNDIVSQKPFATSYYLPLEYVNQVIATTKGGDSDATWSFIAGYALYKDAHSTAEGNCLMKTQCSTSIKAYSADYELTKEQMTQLKADYPEANYIRIVVRRNNQGTNSNGGRYYIGGGSNWFCYDLVGTTAE